MIRWLCRCAPVLSSLLLICVTYGAFVQHAKQSASYHDTLECQHDQKCFRPLSAFQILWVVYTLVVSTQLVIIIPQLCYALHTLARSIANVRLSRACRTDIDRPCPPFYGPDCYTDSGYASDASMESQRGIALSLPAQTSLEDRVIHAIVLPNYQEDLDTLRETLSVLASHDRAVQQYEVVLAMEAKEPNSSSKAKGLISEFESEFRSIYFITHPTGVPGEIAGKSSNVAYGASNVMQRHLASGDGDDVIITVIDADTILLQDYFFEVRRLHCTDDDAHHSIYCCPIVFDRNSNCSPLLVRCADIMWSWAGISPMVPNWPIAIPTSVYSVPLRLAEAVNGWDTGPNAIGEDMHMLLKCFFGTSGRLATKTVASAASQCNIIGSNGNNASWPCSDQLSTMHARYRQGMRHMWGALDSGYALQAFARSFSRPNNKHFALLHMLWQAHFFPVHLVVGIISSGAIPWIFGISDPHPIMTWTLLVANRLRHVAFVLMFVALYFYNRYHNVCADARLKDMAAAKIPCGVSFRRGRWTFMAEGIAFPVAGFLYGTVPALVAEVCHLWTDRLVYVVSKKPKVNR